MTSGPPSLLGASPFFSTECCVYHHCTRCAVRSSRRGHARACSARHAEQLPAADEYVTHTIPTKHARIGCPDAATAQAPPRSAPLRNYSAPATRWESVEMLCESVSRLRGRVVSSGNVIGVHSMRTPARTQPWHRGRRRRPRPQASSRAAWVAQSLPYSRSSLPLRHRRLPRQLPRASGRRR